MLESINDKILFFILLLVSITMHEFGHAFAAYKLGDPLPKLQGRITLNPLAHADTLGTFILPFIFIFSGATILFGWGKPVMMSLANPKTRVRDDILSSLAGPVTNLLLAFIGTLILVAATYYKIDDALKVGSLLLMLNSCLFVFNMLPVPPLDGSHFLRYILKMSNENYLKFQQYGFWILLAIIFFTPFGKVFSILISLLNEGFLFVGNSILKLLPA